jgi:tetratricopeptide (TPR) repeat protein
MAHVGKSVFISYRRTNLPWALAIFHHLSHNGYDVFIDFTDIASGSFERVIRENINANVHFLVLLTPSALERCGNSGDRFRHEIETAIETKRNIVPIMLDRCDFDAPAIGSQLTGRLAPLKECTGLSIPDDYFEEAMARLSNRFLDTSVETVCYPLSALARQAFDEQNAAASVAAAVTEQELSAQQWYERGFQAVHLDEKVRFYGEAIRRKPDYADAFYYRGGVRDDKGDYDGAILDYNEAIRLNPALTALALNNRAFARYHKGDFDGAVRDSSGAIRLDPGFAEAFDTRGLARHRKGDFEGAIRDYNEAIRLNADLVEPFNNRGLARFRTGDLNGAIRDFNEAIGLEPNHANAFYNRGLARQAKSDFAGAEQDEREARRLGYKPAAQPLTDGAAFSRSGFADSGKPYFG